MESGSGGSCSRGDREVRRGDGGSRSQRDREARSRSDGWTAGLIVTLGPSYPFAVARAS